MNYYKIHLTIHCVECFDTMLSDIANQKELLDEIYYESHITSGGCVCMCSSVLEVQDMIDLIEDAYPTSYDLTILGITHKEFVEGIATLDLYQPKRIVVQKIEHIFNTRFSNTTRQQEFILYLQSLSGGGGYTYAGKSHQGDVYVGYAHSIKHHNDLIGIFETLDNMIKPYDGVCKK